MTATRQLTDLERAVRRARHVVRNPVANPALDAKHVAPMVAEFDRREDEIERLMAQRDAVLALHQPSHPDRRYPSCTECTHGCGVGDVDWPCSTLQALGGAA